MKAPETKVIKNKIQVSLLINGDFFRKLWNISTENEVIKYSLKLSE